MNKCLNDLLFCVDCGKYVKEHEGLQKHDLFMSVIKIEDLEQLIKDRIKELEEERKKIIYGVYQMEDLKANKIDAKIDELKRLLGSD